MNEQQKRFADKYFETLNGTQSAIYAGYSEKTANEYAVQLLQRKDVQLYLIQLRAELAEKTGISQQKILNELGRIAFADIRKFYQGENELIPVCDLGDDEAAALASLKTFEEKIPGTDIIAGLNKEIKLYDKLGAIEKLMKHLGMFEKDNEQAAAKIPTSFTVNVVKPKDE